MSLGTRGVALLLLCVGVTGCSSDLPALSAAEAAACSELTAALPDRIAGQDLSDDTDRTAAWADIELTCGVGLPAAYDDFSDCSVVGDVGWFLPPVELEDPSADILLTSLTYTPRVSVLIPAARRGSDEVQSAIAAVITTTLTEGEPCL